MGNVSISSGCNGLINRNRIWVVECPKRDTCYHYLAYRKILQTKADLQSSFALLCEMNNLSFYIKFKG